MPALDTPRLLNWFDPIRGRLKADYTDFLVEEVPLYEACGEGTHTYFLLEKRGLSTLQAINDLAQSLGVRRFEIGFAGMKDSRAVTRQWMSLEHVPPEELQKIDLPRLRIVQTSRHRNKLKIGHLRGNRFTIRIRDTDVSRLPEFRKALGELATRGVPNYFGEQRFGTRGDSWRVGAAMLRGDLPTALDWVLGQPDPRDEGEIAIARRQYVSGDYEAAARHWPQMFRDERRALKTLAASKGNKKRAFLSIDDNMRRFYVSAYQSFMFNEVVAERLGSERWRIELGDLATVHRNGAVFRVEDEAVEQPRFDALEISPSGPLFGYRMTQPTGRAAEIEQAILSREQLTLESFRENHLRVKGGRRPLRFPIGDATVELADDERGSYLEMRFSLPAGCYATTLLRELLQDTSSGTEDAVDEMDDD